MTTRQAEHCAAMVQRASAPSVPQVPRWRLSPEERTWRTIHANLAAWRKNRPHRDERHALGVAIAILRDSGANERLIADLVEMRANLANAPAGDGRRDV